MRQNEEAVRRSRGRPQVRPDEETKQLLIEAARQEFQVNGYASACMANVAQRAGVSTKTLYRLIPTKTGLFCNVVSDRISRFMLAIDAEALDALPVEEALRRMLVAYGTLTLDEETIGVFRLVLGECDRFPEIAATFYDAAIRRTNLAMEAWLRRQCDRGVIALEDPLMATGALRGMMTMEPQRAVMLGQRAAPDAAEIARRAEFCTRLFLEGCRQRTEEEGRAYLGSIVADGGAGTRDER
jgi:AcrR family transcriptional regulator